jgi:protein SCO1
MNESAASRLSRPALLLIALLVAGCRADPAPPPLEGAAMGGPFTLTGDDGRRVSDTDFAGKYRLVYFGFTHCPDVCPVDLQTIGAGLRRFERDAPERGSRVQPLFITVDPARDTPEILHRYVGAFHPRLIGLTGSEAEIARVARAYAVYFRRGAPQAGGGYAVDHTQMAVLYGPAGEPVVIVPHDRGAAGVAAELDRWVR